MKRIWFLAFACAIGCGGQSGTLAVTVVTPVGDDPFAQAAQAHVKLGDPAVAEQTVSVSGGHFDVSLKYNPPSSSSVAASVLVEALDGSGQVIGRGHSPLLALVPADAQVTVWVGRVGKVGLSAQTIAEGRDAIAGGPLPQLGAMLPGGGSGGQPSTENDIYDEYSHQVQTGAPLPAARAGALVLPFVRSDQVTGAALVVGGAGDLAQFDPLQGTSGAWSTLTTDAALAPSSPAVALQGDGTWLVAGGLDGDGKPAATAFTVAPPPAYAFARTAAPMAAARAGHTATPIAAAQGAGVLVFGGAAAGPDAELYVTSARTFTSIDLGVPSRTGHTATALSDGRVLILGGGDGSAPALADGVLVAPPALTATPMPSLLATARTGHSANLVGTELLVCGGKRADGTPIADCEVLDAATFAMKRVVPLHTGRSGHVVVGLDTGDLLIAGGRDAAGPLNSLELYTP